ncbi:hypothetical protein ACFLYH_01470 [Candidatus Dependentiae bacterium]
MIKKINFVLFVILFFNFQLKAMEKEKSPEKIHESNNEESYSKEEKIIDQNIINQLDNYLKNEELDKIHDLIKKAIKTPLNLPLVGDWILNKANQGHIFFLYLYLENTLKLLKNKQNIFYSTKKISLYFKNCLILLIRVFQDIYILQSLNQNISYKKYEFFRHKINASLDQLKNFEPNFDKKLLDNISDFFDNKKKNFPSPATTTTYYKSWWQWLTFKKNYNIYGYMPDESIKKIFQNSDENLNKILQKDYKKTFDVFMILLNTIKDNYKNNSERWEYVKNISFYKLREQLDALYPKTSYHRPCRW